AARMRARSFWLVPAGGAGLLLSGAALSGVGAQPPAPALTGQVTTTEAGAMEGVLVSAQKSQSPIIITVVSDQNGRFSFPAAKLAPGHYALRIRASGYELDGPQDADVAEGNSA